ncbi:hypothetical protein F442_02763, partial [Phytophthora nicotianae P10297]
LLAPDTRHESKKKFLHESSQTGTEEIHFKTPRRGIGFSTLSRALEDNLFVASDLNVYAKANYHQNLTTLF